MSDKAEMRSSAQSLVPDTSSAIFIVTIRLQSEAASFRATARAVESLESMHFATLGELCAFLQTAALIHPLPDEPTLATAPEISAGRPLNNDNTSKREPDASVTLMARTIDPILFRRAFGLVAALIGLAVMTLAWKESADSLNAEAVSRSLPMRAIDSSTAIRSARDEPRGTSKTIDGATDR